MRLQPIGDDELDEHVTVMPGTLNSGDWFDVQVVYDGSPECNPVVTTRIKGQTRKMRPYEPRSERTARHKFSLTIAMMIVSGLIGYGAAFGHFTTTYFR